MTYNDIIAALRDIGLGGTDALTHETVISGATLDESINGDGGLTVSWKSTEGGMIRGGTMFMGYVMKENYVPTLGSDGIYMWSPKFSEPAVLLGKNNFGKSLLLHVSSDIYVKKATEEVAATVVAVVDTDRDLPAVTSLSTGTFAIVKNPKTIYASNSRLRKVIVFQGVKQWSDNGQVISENGICRKGATGHYWRYAGGGWIDIGAGDGTVESTVYTSPFCGELGTIVDELNIFLAQNLPAYERSGSVSERFRIELHSEKPTTAKAEAEIEALRGTFINITFDGSTLKELIDKIAEAADAHAYYVGRKIIIGKTRAYADTDFFNRFIVLGGTKNMAKRTFNGQGYAAITQRLHLDENDYPGSVIDLRSSANEAPFEAFLVFDDIYPKLNLNIATAKYCICYCLDDNGKKIPATKNPNEENPRDWKLYAKWYVTLELDGQPYTIDKNYIIQDKPLSLLFQSGPLTGRQFELTMLTADSERNPDFALQVAGDGNSLPESHTVTAGECYIILEADGDFLLPTLPATFDNGGLCPQAGNWVTLVNVAIEDSFRIVAQKELLKKGRERAELIYESKQPTISEERTFTDSLTGENSGDVPGLGEPYKGYIVTGISENIITGAKTVTYGTFKPKPLMKSAIDKIETFTLSGGEATTGKEVSTKTDDGTTIIYIHDGSEGGDNSTPSGGKGGSSGTTSQSQSTTIRQAGGNINIKTVYEKVGEVKDEVDEVGKSVNVSELFANLAMALWKACKEEIERLDEDEMNIDISATQPEHGRWWYNGTTLYGWSGDSWVQSSEDELAEAFSAIYTHIGEVSFCLYNGRPGGSNKYDIFVVPSTFTSDGVTFEGGIQAWMCIVDGEGATATKKWIPILDSSTAIINNLGSAIQQVVFGGTGNDRDDLLLSSGMLTTKNFVTLFSQAITAADNTVLAQAMLTLGIRYSVTIDSRDYDVEYDIQSEKWIYSDTEEDVEEEYLDKIVPSSFVGMSADDIDFTAGTFTIGANHIVISGNDRLDAFVSGEAGRINNAITTATSGMVTENNFVTIFSEIVSPTDGNAYTAITKAMLGMGIKYHYVGGNVFDVEWDGHNWLASSDHEIISDSDVENIQPYSYAGLTADVIDFKGKTINLTGDTLTFSGGAIDMKASTVKFQTNKFSIYPTNSNTPIALFSNDGTKINGGSIDFAGKTINLTAQNGLTISGGTLTMASGSTLDLTATTLLINASQIGLDADDIIDILAGGDLGVVFKKENNNTIQMGKFDGTTFVAGLEFLVSGTSANPVYTLNLNANNINLNAENITWKGENGGIRDIITNVETIDGQQVTVKKFSVDADGNVTMNDLTANNATLSGILTSTGVRTKITIDATDGSDTDTAMKMFALVSDNGSTIAKPVLKVGIDDYLYDENDPQSVYQEGAIEICTTDEVHPYRKATVRPQRITVEGNSYVTEIKPSHYYIYNRSDYYSGNNPTPLLEISDSGVRHGGVFKFWTDILANS